MQAASITNRGGRKSNEDYISFAQADGIWCFVLCDGLGGHLCGEVASKLVCDTVIEEFKKSPAISMCAARNYLEKAACVLGEAREGDTDKYNMSSTAVLLLTDGEKAIHAHAGDSRAYRLSDGNIKEVTKDHSLAYMEYESGAITYDDIRRSPNQNRLTRCINDIYGFAPEISDITELKKGDAFLLCSDGFWEYVTESDIENTISMSLSPKHWLKKMLAILHENETNKNDNYSAIAVMIN